MSKRSEENPISHLVEGMVEVAAATQMAGLQVLQAEMVALTHVLPGVGHALTEAERAQVDLQIEAEFDNMPV